MTALDYCLPHILKVDEVLKNIYDSSRLPPPPQPGDINVSWFPMVPFPWRLSTGLIQLSASLPAKHFHQHPGSEVLYLWKCLRQVDKQLSGLVLLVVGSDDG